MKKDYEQMRQEAEADRDQVELRSEKTRELIGQIPPFLIRWGNTILAGVIAVLALVAWLLRDLFPEEWFLYGVRKILEKAFPIYPSARCDGVRGDLLEDDRPILRQDLLGGDDATVMCRHPFGCLVAGDQRCGRGAGVPNRLRADHAGPCR